LSIVIYQKNTEDTFESSAVQFSVASQSRAAEAEAEAEL
jgi:hypothetical protein